MSDLNSKIYCTWFEWCKKMWLVLLLLLLLTWVPARFLFLFISTLIGNADIHSMESIKLVQGAFAAGECCVLFFLFLMLIVFKRKIRIELNNRLAWAVLLTGVYSLFSLTANSSDGISGALISFFYVFGCFCLIYALFRKWSLLVWILLYSLPMLIACVSLRYHVNIDAGLISEILGASPQDVAVFLTPVNILLGVLSLVSVCLFFYVLHLSFAPERRRNLLVCGGIACAFSIGSAAVTERPLWGDFESQHISHRAPETLLLKFYLAVRLANVEKTRALEIASALPSPAEKGTIIPNEVKPEAVLCILHVGESVRSDHMSIFGYHRQTTPNLDSEKRLIAFRDCVSTAPSTIPSTMAILTNARGDVREKNLDASLEPTCGGVMDLFHANEFTCYALRNVENKKVTWGAVYEKLCSKVFSATADKEIYNLPGKDCMYQIDQMEQLCRGEIQNKNAFVLVTNNGSHLPFKEYDYENPPFVPASSQAYNKRPDVFPDMAEEVVNAYDNTIAYLDEYIARMLKLMEGRPFVYIYISDHGEYLGDKGVWVRNHDKSLFFNTSVCQVPLLIIASPEFENMNPHYREALERLRENVSLSIGQEHIFHTLLGLFGIQSPYYDETLDLTSPRVMPYTGPHPSRGGLPVDKKKRYW